MQRVTIAFCLIVGAFILPWWATLLLALYGAFRFPLFVEALVAGVIIDTLYGTHELFGIPGVATLSAVGISAFMMFIRRHIRHESFSA